MNPVALIIAILNALAAKWTAEAEEAKTNRISAVYDLQKRISTDIDSREDEIHRLRDTRNDDDARRADLLRQRLEREQGVAASFRLDLPTPAPSPQGGSPGADDKGNLHPVAG